MLKLCVLFIHPDDSIHQRSEYTDATILRLYYKEFFIMNHILTLCFLTAFCTFLCATKPDRKVNTPPHTLKELNPEGSEGSRLAVERLYQSAKYITHDSKTSERTKASELTKLVLSSWNMDKIAEYTIFPYWKSFSKKEKLQFKDFLTQNIVRTFQKVSKKYLSSLKVSKVSPIPGKSNAYEVRCTVVNKEDGRTVDVRFHVVSDKIRNLFVEKLNLVDAKKKEFSDLMRKNRKSIPNFLKALQKSLPTPPSTVSTPTQSKTKV